MQVEIFHEVTESGGQHPECNSESLKILEELGLNLQIEKYAKKGNVVEQSFPFKQASMEELFVFKSTFPNATPLEKFDAEIIPLRVLEILKIAKDSKKFSEFSIWHKELASIKEDSILFGLIKTTYASDFYPIARWGDSLISYAELKKEALEKFKTEANQRLAKAALEIKNNIEKVNKGFVPRMSLWNNSVSIGGCSFSGYFN